MKAFKPTSRQLLASTASLLCLFVAISLAGCARTISSSEPSPAQKVIGSTPAAPQESGFLKDYSQLTVGGEGKPSLVYIDPNAQWMSYSKVIVEPVQFWAAPDSTVSTEDASVLCSYFDEKLKEHIAKHFTIVDAPGQGVFKLDVALTDATTATPVLRTATVIIPQARTLNTIQSLARGSYLFVGHAKAEGQVLDSATNQRIAAFVDEREGGIALSAAATWQWGDAEAVIDFWAQKITERLVELHSGSRTTIEASN